MSQRPTKFAALRDLPHFTQNMVELLFASAGINLLALALPLTMLQVYDRVIPNRAHATLLWITTGCALAMMLEALLRIARAQTGSWLAARFEHTMGTRSVSQFLSARLDHIEGTPVGELLERLNASGILRHFYSGQLFQVLLDVPFAGLYLFAVYLIGGQLVLWPIAIMSIFLLTSVWFRKKFEIANGHAEDALEHRQSFLIEVLSGMHTVRAQTFEEQLLRHYEELQHGVSIASYRIGRWNSIPRLAGTISSQLTMFGTMVIGGLAVIQNELTMGGLVACTMLAGRAMGPIQQSASFFIHFAEARSARKQIESIENLEQEAPPDAPSFPAEIDGQVELRDLSFAFPNGKDVFRGVNCRFAPRSLTVITAAPGAGASSLLCCTMGLLKPSAGSVLIDGYDIHLWERTRLWGRIEYLPANAVIFAGTILDNVARFDPSLRQIAQDTATLVGLDPLVSAFPRGYETMLESLSSNRLPSGFVQRLALARALVVRPRILLADRVDSVMDGETLAIFSDLVAKLKNACTVIMVTNSERFTRKADRILVLDKGELGERAPQGGPA